jgi:hypothetical protein
MKLFFLCCVAWLFSFATAAQNWTPEQIEKANTAKSISYLTKEEKETILYINLCRLYPQEFAEKEVRPYVGNLKYGDYVKKSPYRKSLFKHLQRMQPVPALLFDEVQYQYAKCFAKEQGESGKTGHERTQCEKGFSGECCSYGMETGKDIAMQLLIDHDVPSLGHRQICLNAQYKGVGVSVHAHKAYDFCTVLDFAR